MVLYKYKNTLVRAYLDCVFVEDKQFKAQIKFYDAATLNIVMCECLLEELTPV